jgi:hypothetical protein
MKALYSFSFLLMMSIAYAPLHAQTVARRTSSITATSSRNDDTADAQISAARGIVLHADPRLAVLVKKSTNIKRGLIRSGKGYRVQIYNGNDRAAATRIKIDFMRRFPGVRTYMTYVAPQFRVKVGDFQSRGDAQRMYSQVSGLYRPVMIVPDLIVVNTLRDDK